MQTNTLERADGDADGDRRARNHSIIKEISLRLQKSSVEEEPYDSAQSFLYEVKRVPHGSFSPAAGISMTMICWWVGVGWALSPPGFGLLQPQGLYLAANPSVAHFANEHL
jgi:hypothetical protein